MLDSFYKHDLFDYGDISWNNLTDVNSQVKFQHWNEQKMILDVNDVNESPKSNNWLEDYQKREGGEFIRDYQLLNNYVLDTKCLFNIVVNQYQDVMMSIFS